MSSAIQTQDQTLNKLLTCLTVQPHDRAFKEGDKRFIQQFLRPKVVVFLAFPMKCGGTFLREALCRCLHRHAGMNGPVPLLRGSYMGAGDGERDLYYPGLFTHFAMAGSEPAVLHNHTLATLTNRLLVDLFHLRPVVMQRSIPDMLRSFYDVAEAKQRFGGHGSGFSEDETFWLRPIEDRKEYLIRNVAPWYVKFYASWALSEKRGDVRNVHWVDFDDFRSDAVDVLDKILRHYDIELGIEDIQASVGETYAIRSKLRFNKGSSGRGAEFFSSEQLEQIASLTDSYEEVDFRARGLV